ncbi:DUF1839 family protein [Oryzibacter oryziterrae]|uniref:DUF1839 family protein n=1 Tax=Oryzibacter oryziterrae TaxID=2766474 RepID=UPI001F3E2690|nr:DUF1839 family protein [Oryzibacter oryziterrae]
MSALATSSPPAGGHTAVFPALDPASYRPHPLHAAERAWPETNCSVDLWIEMIACLGAPPEAAFGFTLTQDFEGDQFTFFKIPPEDLEHLYGLRLAELAIFDDPELHLAEQVARGRLCLIELDSFFLPDTRGVAYGLEHGKTTVGVNRIDLTARRLDYFHNAGYFTLEGADFDGLFQIGRRAPDAPFLPYTEFVKLPERIDTSALADKAAALLARHLARVPVANPVTAFAQRFAAQAAGLYERPAFFHKYAFNTLRQLGANFLLLSDHLDWLEAQGKGEFAAERDAAFAISETAKIVQFQLARAVARRKADSLPPMMTPAAESWDKLIAGLTSKLG